MEPKTPDISTSFFHPESLRGSASSHALEKTVPVLMKNKGGSFTYEETKDTGKVPG